MVSTPRLCWKIWSVFQPNRTLIRPRAVAQLVSMVDAAAEVGLDVSVDGLQGHLSSFDYVPAWLRTWHRRNLFTDPDTGFYWYSTKGMLTGPMKEVSRPNGIELTLDENTLIVGDVGNREIHTFALGSDGAVITASDHLFVTAMKDTVDGMCTDCAGNLYAATSGGIEVYSAAGAYIGNIATGDTSNCTFGGADRKTLYTTSRSAVQAVTLGIPGLPD